jgi:hypothetical protein
MGLGRKCHFPENYSNEFIAFWKRALHILVIIGLLTVNIKRDKIVRYYIV